MGMAITYDGAIRIQPMLAPTLLGKLNTFTSIRHMKRDTNILSQLYDKRRKEVTLWPDGDFGPEGLWFIPEQITDLILSAYINGAKEFTPREGIMEPFHMNVEPSYCPSLYCDLEFVSDIENNCSYIGWNGSECSKEIQKWLALFAKELVKLGYSLDGIMFENVEGGMSFGTIEVNNDKVHYSSMEPSYTYSIEFDRLTNVYNLPEN